MSMPGTGSADHRTWLTPIAWTGLPVLAVTYAYLRFALDSQAALALAQVVYLIPPMLAATFSASAAWVSAPNTRARWFWVLLASSTALLFVSEVYYSWGQLTLTSVTNISPLFDLFNLIALGCLVLMMSVAASLERLGFKRSLRLFMDTGALLTFGFVLVFRFLLGTLAGQVEIVDAARMTAYSLAGLLISTMSIYIYVTTPLAHRRSWTRALAVGVGCYALGVTLWPFWSLSATGQQQGSFTEALVALLFLAGYYIMFMAGLYRIMAADQPWEQTFSQPWVRPAAWQGVTISVLVLLTVVYLGFATYSVPPGSRTQLVHWASLIIATTCMVGRTALATLETDELRSRSLTDPVTGAPNPRSFDEQIVELFAANRRFGEPFSLILTDMDDFGRVNESMSLSAGDRVLTDVAVAIAQVIGSRDNVFRISSDEFAILVPNADRRDTDKIARVVKQAVRTVPVPGRPLTASLGYAVCPDDALQRDAMLARADAALAWAKRHGKDRVVGYDDRVERALGADEQIRMLERDTTLDMVRALSAAADARDPANHFHARSVAALSCLLAGEMGLESEHVERIRIAALLHDVGKIAAPSTLYGRKTAERLQRAIGEHCELGERMLHSLAVPGVATWVRGHHERWDGRGFPDGLKSHAIPVESRIIALADAYDLMTSESRPGGPVSTAAALQEIDQGIGTRFDPALAEKFILLVAGTESIGGSDEWPAA